MVGFVISSCNCIGVNLIYLLICICILIHVVLFYPCDMAESEICGFVVFEGAVVPYVGLAS